MDEHSRREEILAHMPKWVTFVREICIEIVKTRAPDEYEKLREEGYVE